MHAYIKVTPPHGTRFIAYADGSYHLIFETTEKGKILEFVNELRAQVETVSEPVQTELKL